MPKTYAVVIEKANGNYSAYVPDLRGCVAGGDTIDECAASIQEAVECWRASSRDARRRHRDTGTTLGARDVEIVSA